MAELYEKIRVVHVAVLFEKTVYTVVSVVGGDVPIHLTGVFWVAFDEAS